jgi:hypothetical protein
MIKETGMNKTNLSNSISRICSFLLVFLIGFGFTHGAVLAQSNDQTSFGIRPTKSYEGKPETSSYFSYESAAGTVINDEALVINDGKVPVVLKLFAADGITAQNGGTSLVGPNDPGARHGVLVSNWISIPTDQVSLNPGEQKTIPFTITIPVDALPGQHVGGLMVESVPTAANVSTNGNNQAQFTVNVVKRVGVAIVVDIPGKHTSALVVDKIGFETQDKNGATFAIKVNNIGNTLITAQGNFMVKDQKGNVLASLPVKVDTILPGDSTTIYLFEPLNLADGDYYMSIGLIYDGGTAILENIDLKMRQGIAVAGGADILKQESQNLTPAVIKIRPAANVFGTLWLLLKDNQQSVLEILLVVGLIFILGMGYLFWRRRTHGAGKSSRKA